MVKIVTIKGGLYLFFMVEQIRDLGESRHLNEMRRKHSPLFLREHEGTHAHFHYNFLFTQLSINCLYVWFKKKTFIKFLYSKFSAYSIEELNSPSFAMTV